MNYLRKNTSQLTTSWFAVVCILVGLLAPVQVTLNNTAENNQHPDQGITQKAQISLSTAEATFCNVPGCNDFWNPNAGSGFDFGGWGSELLNTIDDFLGSNLSQYGDAVDLVTGILEEFGVDFGVAKDIADWVEAAEGITETVGNIESFENFSDWAAGDGNVENLAGDVATLLGLGGEYEDYDEAVSVVTDQIQNAAEGYSDDCADGDEGCNVAKYITTQIKKQIESASDQIENLGDDVDDLRDVKQFLEDTKRYVEMVKEYREYQEQSGGESGQTQWCYDAETSGDDSGGNNGGESCKLKPAAWCATYSEGENAGETICYYAETDPDFDISESYENPENACKTNESGTCVECQPDTECGDGTPVEICDGSGGGGGEGADEYCWSKPDPRVSGRIENCFDTLQLCNEDFDGAKEGAGDTSDWESCSAKNGGGDESGETEQKCFDTKSECQSEQENDDSSVSSCKEVTSGGGPGGGLENARFSPEGELLVKETRAREKDRCLDALAQETSKKVLGDVSKSALSWVQSGFEVFGETDNSAIVEKIGKHLTSLSYDEFNKYIRDQTNFEDVCGNFSDDVLEALQREFRSTPEAFGESSQALTDELPDIAPGNCDLEDVVADGDVEEYLRGDFTEGGWEAWNEIASDFSNTPVGAYIEKGREYKSKIDEERQNRRDRLNQSGGFLSDRDGENVITPGSVVSNIFNKISSSDVRRAELADEMNEVVGEYGALLSTQIIQEGATLLNPEETEENQNGTSTPKNGTSTPKTEFDEQNEDGPPKPESNQDEVGPPEFEEEQDEVGPPEFEEESGEISSFTVNTGSEEVNQNNLLQVRWETENTNGCRAESFPSIDAWSGTVDTSGSKVLRYEGGLELSLVCEVSSGEAISATEVVQPR